MKIYYIYISYFGYDCNQSHIVVANNRKEVIEEAKYRSRDEGKDVRDNAGILCIGQANKRYKKPQIILSDFNAG